MQTFTLTLYGASVSDVQRLLTEAGLTGLSFAVTWDSDDDDVDVAAASPSTTDIYPFEGYDLARHNHPSRGGL